MIIEDPVEDSALAVSIGFDKSVHSNCSNILFDNLARNPGSLAIKGPMRHLTYRELCTNA